MIVSEEPVLRPEHLPPQFRAADVAGAPVPPAGAASVPATGAPLPTLEQMERAHVEAALRASGGHRGRAAAILGISERNLYRRIKDWELSG